MRSAIRVRGFALAATILTVALVSLPLRAFAESWDSFSSFIAEVDYAAQQQSLVRDGKVIGTRTVKEYWRSHDFDQKLIRIPERSSGWSFREYDRKTDSLNTAFVFYGRGTLLWSTGPIRGAILYPGITTDGAPGAEVTCSTTEFDDLLVEIAALKAEGKGLQGILLPRLGSPRSAMP